MRRAGFFCRQPLSGTSMTRLQATTRRAVAARLFFDRVTWSFPLDQEDRATAQGLAQWRTSWYARRLRSWPTSVGVQPDPSSVLVAIYLVNNPTDSSSSPPG